MSVAFAVKKFPGSVGLVSAFDSFDPSLLLRLSEDNIRNYFLKIIETYQGKLKKIYFDDAISSDKWASSDFVKEVLEYSANNKVEFGLWSALELIAFREGVANKSNEARASYQEFERITVDYGVEYLHKIAHQTNLMYVASPRTPNLNMLTISRLLGAVAYGGDWRKKDFRK